MQRIEGPGNQVQDWIRYGYKENQIHTLGKSLTQVRALIGKEWVSETRVGPIWLDVLKNLETPDSPEPLGLASGSFLLTRGQSPITWKSFKDLS